MTVVPMLKKLAKLPGLAAILLAASVPIYAADAADTPKAKADMMPLPQCPESDLLPGARDLRTDRPQRIPYPEGNENDTGVYGKLTNGQRISGHVRPEIKAGIGAQSGALLRNGALPPALREMIIVRTGYHTASIYEVAQHRSLAASLGVSEAKLDMLACTKAGGLDAKEAAAIALVDELLTVNRPSDPVLAEARKYFSDGEVIEIIFVTGNWWTLARVLETTGVPLDERRIGDGGVAPAGSDGH